MDQRNFRKGKTNIWLFALEIGFFAGLIWGGLKGLMYYFKLTKLVPGYLVEPFFRTHFLHTQAGYYIGWLAFIIFSIIAATIYTLAFRKVKGPWPGIFYGVAWWMIIFLVIGPALQMMGSISGMNSNTLISEFCLYLLWGLFIGYSVAEEYNDERTREPEPVH